MKVLLSLILLSAVNVHAATFICTPSYQSRMGKLIATSESDFVKKHKPYTKIVEGSTVIIQRCSTPYVQNSSQCDSYEADRVEYDSNVQIRKYYVFKPQYDIQIFSDMSFIDNNGRGGFLVGTCTKQQ